MVVNKKLVQRIYREEGLTVRRRKRKRVAIPRTPLPLLTGANERWSMDFVSDALSDGRRFRALTIVDDFTRESPAIEVDTSLPGDRVVRVLETLADTQGCRKRSSVTTDQSFVAKRSTSGRTVGGSRCNSFSRASRFRTGSPRASTAASAMSV
jgi:putative transposase